MTFRLPAMLAIAKSARPARTARIQSDAAHDPAADVAAQLKPQIVEALLRDAMLTARDVGPEWHERECEGPGSMFTGDEYRTLCIAGLAARFECADTREAVEQHIGVLPRWAVRHLGSSFLPTATPAAPGGPHGDCRIYQRRLVDVGEGGVAVRVVPNEGSWRPGVDAAFLRRGALLMALVYLPGRAGTTAAPTMPELAAIADRKWASVAEALR